jgi:hypothetical protein
MSPTFAGTSLPVLTDTCTTTVRRPARRPWRTAASNSRLWRIRCIAGSTTDRPEVTRSNGQLSAPLAPTSGEDGATRTGPHTQPEAVGLRPAPVVRLEGPLAHQKTPRSAAKRGSGGRTHTPKSLNPTIGQRPTPHSSQTGKYGRCQASIRYGGTRRRVKPGPGQDTLSTSHDVRLDLREATQTGIQGKPAPEIQPLTPSVTSQPVTSWTQGVGGVFRSRDRGQPDIVLSTALGGDGDTPVASECWY